MGEVMNSNYRIKKVTRFHGSTYILQKKLLGFLWWYNPDNIDGMITGVYDTEEEAMESYRIKTFECKLSYISILHD